MKLQPAVHKMALQLMVLHKLREATDSLKKIYNMKLDRVMWGIVLLFIGGVLLLENFGIIDFHWGNVWRFWPIFLIIAGVNILFGRGKSQTGGIISIAILFAMLALLFYKGQQSPDNERWIGDRIKEDIGAETEVLEEMNFSHPYESESARNTVLNIRGGGASFELKGATDSLIAVHVSKRSGRFSMETLQTDSTTTISFEKNGKSKWNIGSGGEDVDFRLNTGPVWELNVNMGAGEVKFDLSDYKVRTFNIDGGAAALDIKLGSQLPIADLNVKTGVADVKIQIPQASGCRIKAKTGLSAKDFTGFVKIADGTYQTSNFDAAATKIFINLDGGLSSFEVRRY
ncbi:LiaF transmembrane domain-containing protein [Pedobacter faecalis]|uniref:LiaF transmembrane domain-containing protein n=1 Tax=Pedobacter faecalis TaxID=3041495 RepID=UPI002550A478|nr:DUF5668 domain-containing protein [Pedobacter sp. ELA7]